MRTWVLASLLSVPLCEAYDRIAGYNPGSAVQDYNALDQDMERIMHYLETEPDNALVYSIYTQGGASKPVATLTMPSSSNSIAVGDEVSGSNEGGSGSSAGTHLAAGLVASVSGNQVKVNYTIPADQANAHAFCLVGGWAPNDRITDGCFRDVVEIGGQTYAPTTIDNTQAGRTLQGFSTGAGERLRSCTSSSCPFWLFMEYANFYGVDDFGDKFVLAAMGTPDNSYTPGDIGFSSHNMDFTGIPSNARFELIEKGISFLNVWMYSYRMMMVAVDQCVPDCVGCNDGAVRSWDGAVAFYTGSREGTAGSVANGVFPYNQAQKRCNDFRTCGPHGNEDHQGPTGTAEPAQVNHKYHQLMQEGQSNLLMGNCDDMHAIVRKVVTQMTIPLVQGAIRYSQINARTGDPASPDPQNPVLSDERRPKAKAEGTAFAAAVVPHLAACPNGGAEDAEIIWSNMKHGSTSVDHVAVRAAFERHYACLNFTCAEVGGFYDHNHDKYFPGSEPCVDSNTGALMSNEAIIGVIVAAVAFLALCLCTCLCIIKLVNAEKSGKPIFTSLDNPTPGKESGAAA